MVPSTTIGSVASPIGLSMSSDQASPSRPTFLSLICLSGLKCCEPKSPPSTSQLRPPRACAITRASVTSPACLATRGCAAHVGARTVAISTAAEAIATRAAFRMLMAERSGCALSVAVYGRETEGPRRESPLVLQARL